MYNKSIPSILQSGPKMFQLVFCQKLVKSPLHLLIFGTQMAKTIGLCEVHSLFTSPNLCQRTTA